MGREKKRAKNKTGKDKDKCHCSLKTHGFINVSFVLSIISFSGIHFTFITFLSFLKQMNAIEKNKRLRKDQDSTISSAMNKSVILMTIEQNKEMSEIIHAVMNSRSGMYSFKISPSYYLKGSLGKQVTATRHRRVTNTLF